LNKFYQRWEKDSASTLVGFRLLGLAKLSLALPPLPSSFALLTAVGEARLRITVCRQSFPMETLGQTGNPRWIAVSDKIKDFEKQGRFEQVLTPAQFNSLPIPMRG